MTKYESLIKSLCPHDTVQHNIDIKLPLLSHLAGTNKFLGDLYGIILIEECGLNIDSNSLTELSCLLRAYIVLDDLVKDNSINLNDNPFIEKWLINLKCKSLKIISTYPVNADFLWNKYHGVYQSAYNYFDQHNIWTSIIEKCYLAFLPFELLDQNQDTQRQKNILSSIKNYLFCLQLIDDFQDMDEDIQASKNHNIFIGGLSPLIQRRIIESRYLIIKDLLEYIWNAISNIFSCFEQNTAKHCLSYSLSWLEKKIQSYEKLPSLKLFNRNIRNFTFEYHEIIRFTKQNNFSIEHKEFHDIKAENMHAKIHDFIG